MTPQQQADAFNARYKVGSICRHAGGVPFTFTTASEAFVRIWSDDDVQTESAMIRLEGVEGDWLIENLVMEEEG